FFRWWSHWWGLNARGQLFFCQRLIRPGLRMILQVLEHLGLHVGDKLRLPIVNEGGVGCPLQNPLGPFDSQWMERVIECVMERGGQRRVIDQGLRIGTYVRVQSK